MKYPPLTSYDTGKFQHYKSVGDTEGDQEGHSHTLWRNNLSGREDKEILGAVIDEPLMSMASHNEFLLVYSLK